MLARVEAGTLQTRGEAWRFVPPRSWIEAAVEVAPAKPRTDR